jgi:hypothetical protein
VLQLVDAGAALSYNNPRESVTISLRTYLYKPGARECRSVSI